MSGARWTSRQYKAMQSDRLDRKIKAQPKVKKIDLFPLACLKMGLPEPMPEYRFHHTRKWRIDYYFEHEGRKVGLEVEGGVWVNGRHNRGKGFLADIEKYNAAIQAGIVIIRVTPDRLMSAETFDTLKKVIFDIFDPI